MKATKLADREDSLLESLSGGWVRIRDIDANDAPRERASLRQLRIKGVRTCVLLRNPVENWRVAYLPINLNEAFDHGRRLGSTFGDLVDAWEIDNEPDLGFVPESAERYAAFLKATYLGLQRGFKEQAVASQPPLVVMGGLGLPPGPWLERFSINDGFAYIDGFNYHYYGYAEDFSAVYRQHQAAFEELTAKSGSTSPFHSHNSPAALISKNFPVFITEIGYGMLTETAARTKEGRLRQWRWFKSVRDQISLIRPEAPMGFYLPPYRERTSEFGLTGAVPRIDQSAASSSVRNTAYSPADFGADRYEPWMDYIGARVDNSEATPALAYWLKAPTEAASGKNIAEPNKKWPPHSWKANVPAPSPIVIDFIAGPGLSHVKRYAAYFVTDTTTPLTQRSSPSGNPTPAPLTLSASKHEEFSLQIRTQNGNLFEVYPTRQAKLQWENYFESYDNFTAAFYGRALPPWRLRENKPVSLVMVMYPNAFPAIYEIRNPRLVELRPAVAHDASAKSHGQGTLVLYNFSAHPVTGTLTAPAFDFPVTKSHEHTITLAAGERLEIPTTVSVAAGSFDRYAASADFVPSSPDIPSAHFRTDFIPDIAGLKPDPIAFFLPEPAIRSGRGTAAVARSDNARLNDNPIINRLYAREEPSKVEVTVSPDWSYPFPVFAQPGTQVERSADGILIRIMSIPGERPRRVEVEFPWPDTGSFSGRTFLSLDYRLR